MTDPLFDPATTGRRRFLKSGLATGAVAPLLAPRGAAAEPVKPKAPAVVRPHSALAAAESETPSLQVPEHEDAQHIGNPGSDFMVDLLRFVGIDYVAAMPGSTFRGIHESIVNYGGNRSPELIVCAHEEASAAIAHGYAKVAGKPMACLVHATVGLQHASMGIYNAWCDRVPMMVIAGNIADAAKRRTGVEPYHTAQDLGTMVRDFTKWDDAPVSLQGYAESFVRAYSMSVTPPMEPVLIVADAELQENPIEHPHALRVPPLVPVSFPAASPAAIAAAAKMLAGASAPLIVVDRAVRTDAGMQTLVALAEALNAPVIDLLARMNFPSGHYLNQTFLQRQLVAKADVILALEVGDVWAITGNVSDSIGRPASRVAREDVQLINVNTGYLYGKSNTQDAERYSAASLPIAADAETMLPQLLDAVRAGLSKPQRDAVLARKAPLQAAFRRMRDDAASDSAIAWDASPVSTARLCQEIWKQIEHEHWALVSSTLFVSRWPQRLWNFSKVHQYIGGEGGYGVGYGAPAAVGAAIAHAREGRISINIQTDGDLMVLPNVLWTAAHHRVPLLTVMHNNRAWHQETMHIQRMANRRDRGPERARIGSVLTEPNVDFAMVARGMGMWSEGVITDPAALAPAIARALAVVKGGAPALLDVYTQPR